jgi:hypothetical protein
MKVIRDDSDFKPITIVMESKDEFLLMMSVLGNTTAAQLDDHLKNDGVEIDNPFKMLCNLFDDLTDKKD